MHFFLKRFLTILILSHAVLQAETIRIMPLGDSITYGYPTGPGYRGYLWNKLKDNNSYTVNFVGSRHDGQGFDANHEGYGGYKTYEIAEIVYGLLQDNHPDIILLHIGSNDASPTQGVNSSSIAGLNTILNQIDHYETDTGHPIKIILASVINRRSYHSTVTQYNKNLRNLASSRIAKGDDITLVNMEDDAGLVRSDFADATHPNSSGYSKMANLWFSVLDPILKGEGAQNNLSWLVPIYHVILN
jgi:lysophospholipase L1-like esterase